MKIEAKLVGRDVTMAPHKGAGPDSVEAKRPYEDWEVRFITEMDDLLIDLPSYSKAVALGKEAISDTGQCQLPMRKARSASDYHLEEGGAWGVLVLTVRLQV